MDLTQYYNNLFFENASQSNQTFDRSYHQSYTNEVINHNDMCRGFNNSNVGLLSPDSAISSPPVSPALMTPCNQNTTYSNYQYDNCHMQYSQIYDHSMVSTSMAVSSVPASAMTASSMSSSMASTSPAVRNMSTSLEVSSPSATFQPSTLSYSTPSMNINSNYNQTSPLNYQYSSADKENCPPNSPNQNYSQVDSTVGQREFSPNLYSPKQNQNNSRKTPKIPPIEILQARRIAANMRERKRMNKINSGFHRLKRVLPGLDKNKDLSKFESLLLAQDYIKRLAAMLEYDLDH